MHFLSFLPRGGAVVQVGREAGKDQVEESSAAGSKSADLLFMCLATILDNPIPTDLAKMDLSPDPGHS